MQVFELRRKVIADYEAYIRSFLAIRNGRIQFNTSFEHFASPDGTGPNRIPLIPIDIRSAPLLKRGLRGSSGVMHAALHTSHLEKLWISRGIPE